ncbi:GFA family protein [uncultured Tateyamaria sp.]|uniref:GFA family protein n=1 Tax=uncultured Tateyamaria sp. TaxID=455651 RepID=UPI00262FEDDA|nr:GFA family protein [uncultured Tateyamaria sp.]
MPSDTAGPITARCYCGASRLTLDKPPFTVAYCHCDDCRRWTGAPVAAFAAFDRADVIAQLPDAFRGAAGVERWTCPTCHAPLGAAFDYLPDQIYVPIGIIDQAEQLAPAMHSHSGSALPWLHIDDDLPRADASARDALGTVAE